MRTAEAHIKFHIGDRVRLSDRGRAHLYDSTHHSSQGTVQGFSRDGEGVYVLWDGLKTKYCYYHDLVELLEHRGLPHHPGGLPLTTIRRES